MFRPDMLRCVPRWAVRTETASLSVKGPSVSEAVKPLQLVVKDSEPLAVCEDEDSGDARPGRAGPGPPVSWSSLLETASLCEDEDSEPLAVCEGEGGFRSSHAQTHRSRPATGPVGPPGPGPVRRARFDPWRSTAPQPPPPSTDSSTATKMASLSLSHTHTVPSTVAAPAPARAGPVPPRPAGREPARPEAWNGPGHVKARSCPDRHGPAADVGNRSGPAQSANRGPDQNPPSGPAPVPSGPAGKAGAGPGLPRFRSGPGACDGCRPVRFHLAGRPFLWARRAAAEMAAL